MGLDSIIVNIVALVPIAIIAVYVERYFTSFYIGLANALAVLVTGVTLIFFPPNPQFTLFNPLMNIGIAMIVYAIAIIILGFEFDADTIRIMGAGKLTTGILSMSLVSQYFQIFDVIILLLIIVLVTVTLYVIGMVLFPED